MIRQIFFVGLISLFLTSCQKPLTEEYLMTHPLTLQKEYKRCEQKNTPECDLVNDTAFAFGKWVDEQNNDPEEFGRKLMQQQALVAELKTRSTDSKTYDAEVYKLKIMYAVLALHSPE